MSNREIKTPRLWECGRWPESRSSSRQYRHAGEMDNSSYAAWSDVASYPGSLGQMLQTWPTLILLIWHVYNFEYFCL